MLVTGVVFQYLKTYLSEYLFGFDNNQFKMELMKGEVDISRANVRPDKVNELLDEYNLPFVVKAGMLRNIHLRVKKLDLVHELFTKHIFGDSEK